MVSFRLVSPPASSLTSQTPPACHSLTLCHGLHRHWRSPPARFTGPDRFLAPPPSRCPLGTKSPPSGRWASGGLVVPSPSKSQSLWGRSVLGVKSTKSQLAQTNQMHIRCVCVCSWSTGGSADGCWAVCGPVLPGGMGSPLDAGALWPPAEFNAVQTGRLPRTEQERL